MKKGFHVFFVFMLIAVLAAIANAGQVTLQTGDDGQYINMPTSGTDTLVIPSGVTSFTVYDDGGENGYYSDEALGYLVLQAPEGLSLMKMAIIFLREKVVWALRLVPLSVREIRLPYISLRM